MAESRFLNVRQTAKALGVHENTVRNWEKGGLIHAVRLPGSGFRRFDAAEIGRLRDEMFSQLAPPDEGPVLGATVDEGRIVHHDLD